MYVVVKLWSIISLLWSIIAFCGKLSAFFGQISLFGGQIYLALDHVSPWGPPALGPTRPGSCVSPWDYALGPPCHPGTLCLYLKKSTNRPTAHVWKWAKPWKVLIGLKSWKSLLSLIAHKLMWYSESAKYLSLASFHQDLRLQTTHLKDSYDSLV